MTMNMYEWEIQTPIFIKSRAENVYVNEHICMSNSDLHFN